MTADLQAATDLHPRQRPRCSTATASRTCSTAAAPSPSSQALRAYRNPDGGFGNAIEPDMRAPDSQPVGIHTALEILDEVGVRDDPMIAAAADWLAQRHARRRRRPVLPAERARLPARPVVAARRRLVAHPDRRQRRRAARARRRPPVARRRERILLAAASTSSTSRPPTLGPGIAYDVRFAVAFLNAVPDAARAEAALDALAPAAARLGLDRSRPAPGGDVQTPLDLAPLARTRAARRLFDAGDDRAHLDALAGGAAATTAAGRPATRSGARRRRSSGAACSRSTCSGSYAPTCEDWPSGGVSQGAGFRQHRTMRRSCILLLAAGILATAVPSAQRQDRLLGP